MDDKFLYQNRPPLRSGFSENLYVRLSNLALQKRESNKTFKFVFRFAVACLLVFTLLLTLFEPVRANVLDLIKHIAGFTVEESTSAPVIDEANATVYVDNYCTPQPLTTALKNLPFAFSMPAYIPERFVFNNDVIVTKSSISMSWVDKHQGEILLRAEQNWDMTFQAGMDSAEKISINGQPALLIRGWWDWRNSKWDQNLGVLQLYWRKDGLLYSLMTESPILAVKVLNEDELIKIAESIK